MKFSIKEITVSPPGERTHRGVGWAKIFVHLNDEEAGTMPNVTVEATVPYEPDDTFRKAREAAFERAKAMLRCALDGLESTSLESLDEAADKARQHRN